MVIIDHYKHHDILASAHRHHNQQMLQLCAATISININSVFNFFVFLNSPTVKHDVSFL